jgi:ATP-dependent DNA helicase RecG
LGEDSLVEFKEVSRSNYQLDASDIATALASLANTKGGHVILGVDDTGIPTGVGSVQQADALMRQVSQLCQERIRPAMTCAIAKAELRGLPLIVIEAPAFSPDRPHLVDGRCYVRDANRSRPATRDEQIRILQSADYHFDEQPVEGASVNDLDFSAVQAFLSASGDQPPPDRELPRYLHALKCQDEENHPTVSGIVFFGKDPGRWLSDAHISAVRFNGTLMSGDFLDRKEITGRFPDQMDAAIAFLERHVAAPARIAGFERVDKAIPAAVLREALDNAMIHRDYRASSQVRLLVFDDRVEMINPGDLLNRLTLDSIRLGGISQRRNPVLCSLVGRMGRRELYGLGVPQMIRLMGERGLPEPEFALDGGHFRVVLRGQPAPTP